MMLTDEPHSSVPEASLWRPQGLFHCFLLPPVSKHLLPTKLLLPVFLLMSAHLSGPTFFSVFCVSLDWALCPVIGFLRPVLGSTHPQLPLSGCKLRERDCTCFPCMLPHVETLNKYILSYMEQRTSSFVTIMSLGIRILFEIISSIVRQML